jgi:Arc/MetJ-type ribon-helix-helix transcriptional regulator
MHIDIAPETERVVREELRSGYFQSVDDLILSSVQAWHERHHLPLAAARAPEKSLIEFFRESPLVGLELDFERDRDAGRDIEL